MPRGLPDPQRMGLYVALGQVGLEMVAPVVLGLFLDSHFDWSPWGVIGGAVFGLVGGIMHLVAILNRLNGPDSSQPPRNES